MKELVRERGMITSNPEREQFSSRPVFFVVSSGRCGSETIARTLNQATNCVCLHHPAPELVLEASEYFYGAYPEESLLRSFISTRPHLENGQVYGEVNLQLSLMLPLLQREFVNGRFVWLLRDGRDVVASMWGRGWYDPFKAPALGIWHMARLQGDRTGDFSQGEWARMSAFQKCCWIWTKYNTIIETELTQIGTQRWRRVQLESLRSSLPELCDFLAIKAPGRFVIERHNYRRQSVIPWSEWSEEQRTQFESICGPLMDRWYRDWKDGDGNWRSIPSEPRDIPGLRTRILGNVKKTLHSLLMRLDSCIR